MAATVSLDSLNAANAASFVAALGEVYEHAPWVAEEASARRSFASLAALHEAMIAVVRDAPAERRMALLRGHPDLAGKAARAGTMTAASQAEQAGAGLDRLSDDEFEAFHRLNSAYWSRFGFPFILCVRRHGKDSILRQFERRLANDTAAECEAALGEISDCVDGAHEAGRAQRHVTDIARPDTDAVERAVARAAGEGLE